MSGVEALEGNEGRGEENRSFPSLLSAPRPLVFTRHSTLDTRHFFLIVAIEAVKIPMISSRSLIRCPTISSPSQCFIRS